MLECLEARATPAHLEVVSESVLGQGLLQDKSPPFQQWMDGDLSNDVRSADWVVNGSLYARHYARSAMLDGTLLRTEAYAQTNRSFFGGSLRASIELQVKVVGDAGEADGTVVSLAARNVSAKGAGAQGTVTGPDVSVTFNSAVPRDRQVFFRAKVGDTLTVTAAADTVTDGPAVSEDVLTLALADPPEVTVQAKYDANPVSLVFGPYLAGVKLPNVFTAATPAGDTITKKFRLTIDGVPAATRTLPWAATGTKFSLDTGTLAAGDAGADRVYPFKVEALDAGGQVLSQFDSTIQVVGRLGLDLKVKAVADARAPQPVENARLLAGIAKGPDLDFRPAGIADIPTYYQGRLALSFFEAGTTRLARQYALLSIQGGAGSLSGPVKGSDFRNVVADSDEFDYDVVLTPGNNFKVGTALSQFSDPAHLRVVAVPAWLTKSATGAGAGKYAADANTAAQYGAGAAAYEFVVNAGNLYHLGLPVTSGTPFGLLNGLPSGVDLDADFSVYAPLFEDQAPKVVADQVKVSARLLGDDLFKNVPLKPDALAVTATLDARTLAQPDTVTLATAAPVNLLSLFPAAPTIDRKFGPWQISVPLFTVGFADLKGTVSIRGEFHAALSRLDLSGSIAFKFLDGKIALDQTTGTLALDVAAAATFGLTARGQVTVSVLGYKLVDLLDAQGSGAVTLGLSAHVAANFGGKTGITLDKANTTATADVGYDFDYDISFLTKDPDDPADMKNAHDDKSGSIWNLSI